LPPSDRLVTATRDALGRITSELPAGEERDGQREMAEAVARAIAERRHLVVQAGTGTGKTFAYLVPALVSGRKVVVTTATKALQDQLADKDLPFLVDHLSEELPEPPTWAVLKGRANYVCLQRVREVQGGEQLALDVGPRPPAEEVAALVAWAGRTATGDRAELEREPSQRAWAAVSVGPRECPGAGNCPKGSDCFAERARRAAADADVVVVNTHLYGLHLATGGVVLPEHDVVVVDEAHQLEDTVAATSGVELTAGRFVHLARAVGAILDDRPAVDAIEELADRWREALADDLGRRLRSGLSPDAEVVRGLARSRLDVVLADVRRVPDDGPGDVGARKQRALKAASALVDDLDAIVEVRPGEVAWVEGTTEHPVLRVAPIDVAELLRTQLWDHTTSVLTSATLPATLPERVGLPPDLLDVVDVGSPFDYAEQALLYCAAHLPDPRSQAFDPAMHDELAALIEAAGGRTMALFTSYRALREAVEALRAKVDVPVLSQDDLPKPALVARFRDEPEACLFATMGFWQGVDVPGATLSLLTIDRIPFPRPDDPLLQARRERARADAFRVVDLPRAATLLAQGTGRLIRNATDRGVVAVFDPRLATNASYRWDIVNALPPMRRTRSRAEVEDFLRDLRDPRDPHD
jgi:ATP-dependent DNA helicase DinG